MVTADLETETQKVVSALTTIYSISQHSHNNNNNNNNNSQANNRDQANQYLTQYQRNAIAWEISDRLLSSPCTNTTTHHDMDIMIQTQIYFFAAQTIHTKVRSDMIQLPTHSYHSLKQSLLNHLVKFCNSVVSGATIGNMHVGGSYFRPTVSRLAMALCALSVQIQWYDVIDQLLLHSSSDTTTIGTDASLMSSSSSSATTTTSLEFTIPNPTNISLILEMAQMLPEEATSYRLLVQDRNIRQGFIQGLIEKSKVMFQFFHAIIVHYETHCDNSGGGSGSNSGNVTSSITKQSTLHVKEQILKCILAWVRYINVPATILQETPILNWVFSILHSHNYDINHHEYEDSTTSDMFELAVDVIIEILRCYPSDNELHVGLVQKMIPLVMALAQPQQQQAINTTTAVAANSTTTPFQKALQNNDEDGMRAFCRIFTEMGESYMSLIMHHEDLNQVALVELVLSCSALPDHGKKGSYCHISFRPTI